MLTSEKMENTVVDELNELGLPNMAATFDSLYRSKRFMDIDHLTLMSEVIAPEYQDKITKRINNRLRHARLIGCPEELSSCIDSMDRQYMPAGITETFGSLNFIKEGLNVCILGASGSGKSYLAKALGIKACSSYKVEYHSCDDLLEKLVALKTTNFSKYTRRMNLLLKVDLLILDDFLLNAVMDERQAKVLFKIYNERLEAGKSIITCSQRDPESWSTMLLNDDVSANAIMKRATKHYTVFIERKPGS